MTSTGARCAWAAPAACSPGTEGVAIHSETTAVWAVVLAAGTGARFGGAKQFVQVAGQRLVDLAVQAVGETCDGTVLVLPAGRAWDGPPVDAVVEGGSDRAESVRRGLAAIPAEDGVVVVHQAANPLASPALIRELVSRVRAGAPCAVPGLRPNDLVRRIDGDRAGHVVGRDDLVLVQTPGAFTLAVLRASHAEVAAGTEAVEDTALVSAAGHEVHVVPGDPRNVHVATPEDLEIVRALVIAHGAGTIPVRAMGDEGDCE